MIKVKITNKTGAALARELPTDIHQLYHDMREAIGRASCRERVYLTV